MASRDRRLVKTAATAWPSNGAVAVTYGPSRTTPSDRPAATRAAADDTNISGRHANDAGASETPASRWGNADPIVSAPMTTPRAVPRRCWNQPAATFIPGGYTPASAAPVAKRSARTSVVFAARTRSAFAMLPTTHPSANRTRGLMRSARLSNALNSVPATKRRGTAIVSHGLTAWGRRRSAIIAGATALAENQSVIAKNSVTAIHASMRAGDGVTAECTRRNGEPGKCQMENARRAECKKRDTLTSWQSSGRPKEEL